MLELQYQQLLQPQVTAKPFNQISAGSGREFTRKNHKHRRPRKRSLKANVFILGKQTTANKNADQDYATKTAKLLEGTQSNRRNAPRENQSTTRSYVGKYAVTQIIRQRTATNESRSKPTRHLDKSQTQTRTTQKTRIAKGISKNNSGLSTNSKVPLTATLKILLTTKRIFS